MGDSQPTLSELETGCLVDAAQSMCGTECIVEHHFANTHDFSSIRHWALLGSVASVVVTG